MDTMELIRARHSVRKYTTKKIEQEKRTALTELAARCNEESGLDFQLIFDEPKCFGTLFAKVCRFRDCENYIAIVAKSNDPDADEKSGYYGEKLVLKAQELGLNTCWVAATRGKTTAKIGDGERLVIVIALGYGADQGVPRKSKDISAVSDVTEDLPDWYVRGIEAALLAPTAVNQQKFFFSLKDGVVTASAPKGPNTMIDLGIVKYHFEAVSNHKIK
ncbi:MAG: nitroreductase [Oscillospiraceae bacterium]|nr:nitroreductase [Oscillospiraceae bacterium]